MIVKKSGDLHVLFSAEVLVILPSLTLQARSMLLAFLPVQVLLSCLRSGPK